MVLHYELKIADIIQITFVGIQFFRVIHPYLFCYATKLYYILIPLKGD